MKKIVFIFSFIGIIFATEYTDLLAIAKSSNNILTAQNSDRVGVDSSANQSQNTVKIIFFIGLISTGTLFWYLSQSRKSTKPINLKPSRNSETALLNRVNPRLRRQLLRLINDPKTANRLLMGIYKDNSDRSADWLAEKAIYDLKRGR